MIGHRIKKYREQKRMSVSELATEADVAKSYISSLERNLQSNPSIQVIEKVSQVLGVSVDTILHGESSNLQDESLDTEWLELVNEVRNSGISKEEFRHFIEFSKWKVNNDKG
ncbi:XRE family transcriptional regulator of biofilm formation [Salirhabdus euzebyi]|uniref:XRE family transcriptional regulator of biofilm formation n=1 Tax=Salirhabdus euzebyi TaxID=394506 RepID=A0A841Q5K5_9BACI|nr:helix-turn-helix domain-containing protein [Salirhabdus euzebyi]MBB6453680.1 XRE family transcriptional regulator of biofilm formation [Salirhabdus euzebyi]